MHEHSNSFLAQRDQQHYLPTFKRFPITLERGEGCYVWDVEGKKYLDVLSGIAVNCLGHSHPKVVKALQSQAAQLMHISNFFTSIPQIDLAERLVDISGLSRVFFTNSGAESLEGAIKVARKYAHSIGRGGDVISFENSFHGRTLATIATGKKAYQVGFDPIPTGFKQVPFNDMHAVRAATDQETAAVVIEPIQGEGGINVAEKSFLQELRHFCDEHKIVLIFDEVQCGIARTGKWFAKDLFGIQPDIMTLAKGLGGGVPIGAFLSNERISHAIDFGDHGTTFGGNPLVCAAALAVIETIEAQGLLNSSRENGEWLMEQLRQLPDQHVKEVRGAGLMIGVEFHASPKPLVELLLEEGVIANATTGNVLRLVPPLIISRKELQQLLDRLHIAIKKWEHHGQ